MIPRAVGTQEASRPLSPLVLSSLFLSTPPSWKMLSLSSLRRGTSWSAPCGRFTEKVGGREGRREGRREGPPNVRRCMRSDAVQETPLRSYFSFNFHRMIIIMSSVIYFSFRPSFPPFPSVVPQISSTPAPTTPLPSGSTCTTFFPPPPPPPPPPHPPPPPPPSRPLHHCCHHRPSPLPTQALPLTPNPLPPPTHPSSALASSSPPFSSSGCSRYRPLPPSLPPATFPSLPTTLKPV